MDKDKLEAPRLMDTRGSFDPVGAIRALYEFVQQLVEFINLIQDEIEKLKAAQAPTAKKEKVST